MHLKYEIIWLKIKFHFHHKTFLNIKIKIIEKTAPYSFASGRRVSGWPLYGAGRSSRSNDHCGCCFPLSFPWK